MPSNHRDRWSLASAPVDTLQARSITAAAGPETVNLPLTEGLHTRKQKIIEKQYRQHDHKAQRTGTRVPKWTPIEGFTVTTKSYFLFLDHCETQEV